MSVYVEIQGVRYHQFTSLTLQRSKEAMTCSGSITLSWPGAEMFNATTPPAQEMTDGAKGEVYLDDQKAGTFRIDKRSSKGSGTEFSLDLTFRGLAAALVDSSPDHPSGQENDKSSAEICKTLMDGYESRLVDKSKDSRPQKRFVIREGETIERSIRRATREFGLIAYENEDGDVELHQSEDDEGAGQDLVLGQNFTQWSVGRDVSQRFSKVTTKGSAVATDEKYGVYAEVLAAEAIDSYVEFKKERHITVESDQDQETLKKRAITEARRRTAKGFTVSLTMSSHSDDVGQLWKVGRKHHVVIPVDQVDDELIISQVSFSLQGDTRETAVDLVPPESYSSSEKKADGGKAATSSKGKAKGKGKGAGGGAGGGGGSAGDVLGKDIDARILSE